MSDLVKKTKELSDNLNKRIDEGTITLLKRNGIKTTNTRIMNYYLKKNELYVYLDYSQKVDGIDVVFIELKKSYSDITIDTEIIPYRIEVIK